ncbi:YdhK family protein [Rhodococcus pyridinivorans]|uniref:YdhK family protein n=1 Tax=Rhodococcus pyridinivorans TaxID=103816 RepID=UPI002078FCC0|nr:YdhK family protein [Rhodococcus pyridinivorans]USI92968.1 YdhK family protein [Rhodococcus pyridinivorans]
MRNRLQEALPAGILSGALVLAGCGTSGGQDPSTSGSHQSHASASSSPSDDGMDHSTMEHPMDGGPAPAGIEKATSPKYSVGTEVTLTADHMEGMDGTKATIAGSTDETVYMVDYEAGGMKMTNHKWVVESEIQPAS